MPYQERRTIEYDEPIYDANQSYLGKRRMRCNILITIDLDAIAITLGRKACRSKSGKSMDGKVLVKRVGHPTTLSKELI